MAAEDFAILYSGGGGRINNHDHYYFSLLETYNALVDRGVKEENIIISYSSGMGSDGLSSSMDTQWNRLKRDLDKGEYGDNSSLILSKENFNKLLTYNKSYVDLLETDAAESLINEYDRGGNVSQRIVDANFYESVVVPYVQEAIKSMNQFGIDIDFKWAFAADPSRLKVPNTLFGTVFGKADFGFAKNKNTKVIDGTTGGLQLAIDEISDQIDSDDSLFVWTFDHGAIDFSRAQVVAESRYYDDQGKNLSTLVPWDSKFSGQISSDKFVKMFADLVSQTGSTTFAFAQCMAGGLLAGLLDDEDLKESKSWFGLAATNQREVSHGSFFADAVAKALKNKSVKTGKQLWDAVNAYDDYLTRSSSVYKANEGDFELDKEHPWSSYEVNGNNVNLFANEASRTPWEKAGIQFDYDDSSVSGAADLSFTISIDEDSSFDVVEALRQEFGGFNYFNIFAVNSPKYGSFEIPSSAQTKEFNYIPQADFYGEDQFRVSASFDGGFVADIDVSVEVVSVNDAPLAVDDEFFVPVGAKDFLIDIDDAPGFLDDTDLEGDGLTIVDYSQAKHGVIEKVGDELFRYTPDSGFEGVDSFLYVISDGEDSSVAEVFLGVGIDPSNRISNTLSNTFG